MKSLGYIKKELGMAYTEIAKKLNLSTSTVTDWASGRRPIPADKLEQLSNILNISYKFIVDDKLYVKDIDEVDKIKINLWYLHSPSESEMIKLLEVEKILKEFRKVLNGIPLEEIKDINMKELCSELKNYINRYSDKD